MLKHSHMRIWFSVLTIVSIVLVDHNALLAQAGGELGGGPYERLLIRGGTVIDGTGAPPIGRTDILVEGNRIVEVRGWMSPPGSSEPPTRVIDATGMYVLPGFVDLHGHIRDQPSGLPPEYIYKTWLAHGITTVRDAASHRGVISSLEQRKLSASNDIVAPRIFVYVRTDGAYTSQQRGFDGATINDSGDRAGVRAVGGRAGGRRL